MKKKSFGGFSFTIDRPKGYVKTWPQPGGREKSFTYPVDYGYLPRHTGEDGEGLDFFVGDEPDGHLESFQKLRKNDDNKYVLDETKFLVGVTDQERETIYKLYGPEVWHRKVYRDMDELERDLPKFQRKGRYAVSENTSSEKLAVSNALMRRIQAFPREARTDAIGKLFKNIGIAPRQAAFYKDPDKLKGFLRQYGHAEASLPTVAPFRSPEWRAAMSDILHGRMTHLETGLAAEQVPSILQHGPHTFINEAEPGAAHWLDSLRDKADAEPTPANTARAYVARAGLYAAPQDHWRTNAYAATAAENTGGTAARMKFSLPASMVSPSHNPMAKNEKEIPRAMFQRWSRNARVEPLHTVAPEKVAGVTDAERETILKLYGPEVWHRKVYRDMDDLERDLPKFAGKKKGRYKTADLQSTAYYVGALPFGVVNGIRVAIQSPYRSWRRVVPNILRDFGRNIDGVRDAFGSMADAGLLTGIAGTHASAGYGLYRGGKALHDRLAPPAPEEKIAFDLGAIRRRISTLPNAMRDAFMGSKPTMMAPMVRRTAPTLPRPVPGSYRHTPGAVHGGMLEQAAPTMLAPMTRQSAPQAIEQWANYRGSGSMIDSMAQRAGQLGYPEAAKARTLGEFRDAFTRRGYSPQEVFAPTDPAMMGRMNPVKTQWQTTSKVGSILARFGLHEKLADSLADHGRAAVYGFGSGVLNGVERPYRALRYGMPVEMRYLLNRNISPSTRTDAAAALAGSLVVPTALAYGAYRGGKALLNHLRPEAPEEPTTAKQAALARYGLDKIADIDKKITGEVLMANVGRRPLQRST